MGLIRYLRRRLHIQQLNDVCDSTYQVADQCLKEMKALGNAITSKIDQSVALQQDLNKKSDQAVAGQKLLEEKASQALAVHQDLNKKADHMATEQQELKQKIDLAIAGRQELEKRLDLALSGVEQLRSDFQKVLQSLEQIKCASVDGSRYSSEAVWGELFNQVSFDSTWLNDRRFAAGRWAVGYQYLYAVYRILNEVRPKSILELGLGQSTKLISQYAAANPNVRHQVVEHDPDWIDFFRRNYELPSNTETVRLVWDFITYKEAEHIRVFKNFAETFKGQKFDFISIDAPFGGDMKQYARIDVLKMLPDCLAENFIIIIDDAERSGETNTIKEMSETLKALNIPFAMGRYSGKKDCMVICSENLKFVCSM